MSWAVGYDSKWQRDIGYGVPSICDHPKCNKEIHRGLSYSISTIKPLKEPYNYTNCDNL